MWMQGSTYSQPRHKEEVGWLVLCSAAFTPEESPRYSFYRRLSGPQDQSGHEGVKKNLHPSKNYFFGQNILFSSFCWNNFNFISAFSVS